MNRSARRRLTAAVLTVARRRHRRHRLRLRLESGTSTKAADGGTYTVWDPYPQFDDGSAWAKLFDELRHRGRGEGQADRATTPRDLTNKALLAAQQGNSPDVLIVDNPVVSTLAEAGVLTTTDDNKLDTSQVEPNLLGAGQSGGKTYGIPIGANTLALYYNKKVLKAAGRRPRLGQGLGVADRGAGEGQGGRQEGHHLLRDRHRGGQLPVPALVLGRRREPDRSSTPPQGVAALSLWKDWLDKGYAPNSVHQQHPDHQLAGVRHRRLRLRRERHLAARPTPRRPASTTASSPSPPQTAASPPAPTGGEFVTVPVQNDTGRYATSQKIVDLPDQRREPARHRHHAVLRRARPARSRTSRWPRTPELKPWVDAVKAAKGRTSDDLGTKYPKISEQLWNAVQSALQRRRKSPKDALDDGPVRRQVTGDPASR